VGGSYEFEITHPLTLSHRVSIKTKIETSHPDEAMRGGIS
jgi:hypothetical protein